MDLTPKQQTSEAIRQAETILILTGQHPSVDQAAAVIALTAILRKFGKNVTPIISDNLPASVNVLDVNQIERGVGGSRDFVLKVDMAKAEVDKLRYEVQDNKLNIFLTPFRGSFAPSDVTFGYGDVAFNFDLAIVLGVPTRLRIDKAYEQNMTAFESIPIVNLDFHRSNENYGAVNLIEPNASSLCEMLVALSESLQGGIIDADIATALLMGIVSSTDRFTAAHTSPKSLTVAAQMMAAGARQQAVVRALFRDGRPDNRADRSGTDRGERGTDRNRSNDRGPARHDAPAAQPAPRPQAQAAPQPAPMQPPVQPQPQAQPAHEPQTQAPQSVAELATAPEPAAQEARPAEPRVPDLPIIDPGHIELSEPEAKPEGPIAQAPMPHPMADFAAASEIFNQMHQEDNQRDAS